MSKKIALLILVGAICVSQGIEAMQGPQQPQQPPQQPQQPNQLPPPHVPLPLQVPHQQLPPATDQQVSLFMLNLSTSLSNEINRLQGELDAATGALATTQHDHDQAVLQRNSARTERDNLNHALTSWRFGFAFAAAIALGEGLILWWKHLEAEQEAQEEEEEEQQEEAAQQAVAVAISESTDTASDSVAQSTVVEQPTIAQESETESAAGSVPLAEHHIHLEDSRPVTNADQTPDVQNFDRTTEDEQQDGAPASVSEDDQEQDDEQQLEADQA